MYQLSRVGVAMHAHQFYYFLCSCEALFAPCVLLVILSAPLYSRYWIATAKPAPNTKVPLWVDRDWNCKQDLVIKYISSLISVISVVCWLEIADQAIGTYNLTPEIWMFMYATFNCALVACTCTFKFWYIFKFQSKITAPHYWSLRLLCPFPPRW